MNSNCLDSSFLPFGFREVSLQSQRDKPKRPSKPVPTAVTVDPSATCLGSKKRLRNPEESGDEDEGGDDGNEVGWVKRA